jgi:hypothetical protein
MVISGVQQKPTEHIIAIATSRFSPAAEVVIVPTEFSSTLSPKNFYEGFENIWTINTMTKFFWDVA